MEIKEGKEIKLSAQAKGKPMPTITWYKNGAPLKQDTFMRLLSQDDRKKLLAVSVLSMRKGDVKRHDGVYTIEATNIAGSVTHEVPLHGEIWFSNYWDYVSILDFALQSKLSWILPS